MPHPEPDRIRAAVRERYAAAARTSCCGETASATPDVIEQGLYRAEDAAALPSTAFAASLGCGNPTMLAELRPGEVVLDLGSGGGLDVLLSARRVGPTGKAYGLDMTPEMLDLARRHQREAGVANAEFLCGTIEDVPLPDASVDVIVSNCVVNLSPDKPAVFAEAFRVLKPGGRFAVSDIVLRRALPEPLGDVAALWTDCLSGALLDTEYEALLRAAGFTDVQIQPTRILSRADIEPTVEGYLADAVADTETALASLDGAVISAFVRARKPTGDTVPHIQ